MSEETKDFLGKNIPELKYVYAISEDNTRAWTLNVDRQILPEIKIALTTQLPLWIVAHVSAETCYTFKTYGTGSGKHDIVTRTIVSVFEYFKCLATTRVEHQELSHGIVIAPSSKKHASLKKGIYPNDFSRLKRTPLLADGIYSVLWVSPKGEPIELITAESMQKRKRYSDLFRNQFGQLNLLSISSKSLSGIALGLRRDGSMVIFAKGQPLFVQRAGKWRGMLWNSVKKAISGKFGDIGILAFEVALNLATTGHGGILGIMESIPKGLHKKDRIDIAREKIINSDSELEYSEWLFHSLLSTDNALLLGPAIVTTLASIDGATVLDRKGKLIAYGAVIPSHPSRAEGARSAAARELSENGFVIKISADGPITVYENGKIIIEI